jgi:hypothetical protein
MSAVAAAAVAAAVTVAALSKQTDKISNDLE